MNYPLVRGVFNAAGFQAAFALAVHIIHRLVS